MSSLTDVDSLYLSVIPPDGFDLFLECSRLSRIIDLRLDMYVLSLSLHCIDFPLENVYWVLTTEFLIDYDSLPQNIRIYKIIISSGGGGELSSVINKDILFIIMFT